MNILDILDKHAAWLRGEPEGVKADLPGANLSKANPVSYTHLDVYKRQFPHILLRNQYLSNGFAVGSAPVQLSLIHI